MSRNFSVTMAAVFVAPNPCLVYSQAAGLYKGHDFHSLRIINSLSLFQH
jgi:hypothetical protein